MKRLVLFALFAAIGCGRPSPSAPTGSVGATGPAVDFAYPTTDGGEVSSTGTRGRATAVLFLATYDLGSQLMARRLADVLVRHVPRANAVAVVLEAPEYVVMADAFRSSLSLQYPVAMADAATLGGGGPFGKIDRIPTLVVLDGEGHEVWRRSGVVSAKDVGEALALGSRRGIAPGP